MCRLLISSVLVLGSTWSLLSDTHRTGTIEWSPRYKSFACGSTLTLNISSGGDGAADVIVGVESDAALGDRVEAAAGAVIPSVVDASPQKTFQDLGGSLDLTTPCTISLNSSVGAGKRVALHGRLGANKRIVLLINNETSVNFVVGSGAIIYDGKILVDSGKLHVLKVMAAAYSRGMQGGQEIARDGAGRHIIMPMGFRNHLIETPELTFASRQTGNECCAKATMATFWILVSTEGNIIAVKPTNVPSDSAARLLALVSSLKVKPFVSNGRAVTAEGFLTLLLEPAGRTWYLY